MAIKTARELVLLPYAQRTVTERTSGRGRSSQGAPGRGPAPGGAPSAPRRGPVDGADLIVDILDDAPEGLEVELAEEFIDELDEGAEIVDLKLVTGTSAGRDTEDEA